jgi:4-hydroxy-tetrahydrodipicolinate synthase
MIAPKGIIPAMLTAFNADGSLDEGGTRAHAEWLIGKGVHGLAPCGSTGESVAMTTEERARVIKITVEQAAGRVPVFAGTGHYSTDLSIRLSKDAVEAGADGVMVILPFYYSPTVSSTMKHLRKVSDAIQMPILLYNNPWFAGFELLPAEVKTLVDDGVVNSIKAAHGDPMRVDFLKYLCGDQLSVMYGHDYAPMEAIFAGADGWLSGLPNVVPDLAVAMYDAIVTKKDIDAARKIWQRILPLAYYFMYERKGTPQQPHWLSVFKGALKLVGHDIGEPRLPTEPLTEQERRVLYEAYAQVYPGEARL